MGNIRLQNRYTPSVAAPFVPQPEIPAGTGQQLPNAIENFGASVTRLGAKIQSDQEKEQNFAAQKTFIDEATALPQFLQDQQNSAGENPTDFTKTTNDLLEKRHNDVLAQARASGMAPAQLQELDLKLAGLRQTAVASSVKFQQSAHESYIAGQTGEAADRLSRLVEAMPEALDGALQEFKGLVETLPGIDPTYKAQLYKQYEASLKQVAGMALAERDPQQTVDALSPGKRTYGATPERVKLISETWTGVGLPAQWGFDFAKIESDVGRNQATSGEDNQGLFQLGPAERKGSKGADEATNSRLAAELAAANVVKFRNKFGRMPTEAETYMMHQQGTAGGLALAGADNNEQAWKVIAPYYPGHGEAYIKTAIAQGGVLPGDATVGQVKAFWSSKFASTGNPVLDKLSGPQQMAVLNSAQANVTKQQNQDKAGLVVDTSNATAAFSVGEPYKGPEITKDRYTAAYGDVEGSQKWADFQSSQRVGSFIHDSATLSAGELQTRVDSMKPTDTSSQFFDAQLKGYTEAQQAQKAVMDQRHSDSAAYVMQHYPAVMQAYQGMQQNSNQDTKQAFYASMAQAYDQLGIPQADRKVFPTEAAGAMKDALKAASPEDRVMLLGQLKTDTGPLFDNALKQLANEGKYREAYIAQYVNLNPQGIQVMADALKGLDRIEGPDAVPAQKPDPSVIDAAFAGYLGSKTMLAMDPGALKAMEDLATGLYIERGGPIPKGANAVFAPEDFNTAIRQVVGGTADASTGITKGAHDNNYMTILPPNTTGDAFNRAVTNSNPSFWVKNSESGPPLFENGDVVSPKQIAEEGTFVRVGPDSYIIRMSSNGHPLMDPTRKSPNPYYIVHMSEDTVRQAALGITGPTREPLGPTGQLPSSAEMSKLNLTPQEQYLYDHHVANLQNGDIVKNPDGSISTIKNITTEIDGKVYVLPTIWNGREVSTEKAIQYAEDAGLDKWPSYPNEAAANKRYDQMHAAMEKDVVPVKPSKAAAPTPAPTRTKEEIQKSPEYVSHVDDILNGVLPKMIADYKALGLSDKEIEKEIDKAYEPYGIKAPGRREKQDTSMNSGSGNTQLAFDATTGGGADPTVRYGVTTPGDNQIGGMSLKPALRAQKDLQGKGQDPRLVGKIKQT